MEAPRRAGRRSAVGDDFRGNDARVTDDASVALPFSRAVSQSARFSAIGAARRAKPEREIRMAMRPVSGGALVAADLLQLLTMIMRGRASQVDACVLV